MTVVAFKAGVLAADTKAVDEEGLSSKSTKLFTLKNNSVIGTAGDADARDILDILSKASLSKMPTKIRLSNTKTNFKGIWVFPTGEVFKVTVEPRDAGPEYQAEILPLLDAWAAVGSGGAYALGAMVAGKTAVEACKIACKLDNNCGLPVESIKIG